MIILLSILSLFIVCCMGACVYFSTCGKGREEVEEEVKPDVYEEVVMLSEETDTEYSNDSNSSNSNNTDV